jgi:multidrug efflux system membrane fusion protein
MKTLIPSLALITIASLAAGCAQPEASEAKAAQPVRTEIVAPTLPESGVRYSASIEAFEQVPVAFKAAGYVDDILRRSGADGRLRTAQPGDRVTRGTVLARVRETDYRERVNQSRARLAEGEASLTRARLDLERARTLFASESLTKPELDAAQANFDAAEARMASARADIELALSALRDCELVSPASGVILERRIEAGALAGSGTVAFVLGDLSSVKARFGVPDAMIQSVRLGESIDVIVEAVAGATFAGRVTAVAPAADPQSRVFDVEVSIPNQDGRLRPGMIGTVAIGPGAAAARSAATASLAVPLTAIVRSEAGADQFAVLVVESQNGLDIVHRRPVELGDVMGNVIAVRKGVNEGERVVVSGATLLVDGDQVRVLQ